MHHIMIILKIIDEQKSVPSIQRKLLDFLVKEKFSISGGPPNTWTELMAVRKCSSNDSQNNSASPPTPHILTNQNT